MTGLFVLVAHVQPPKQFGTCAMDGTCRMNQFNIEPLFDQEYVRFSWMLNPSNAAKLDGTLGVIKHFEHLYNIHRIRAPHVIECDYEQADFRRKESADHAGWRFM